MVTDNQVRRLMKLVQTEKTKVLASAKAGMDPKTARKYLISGRLPSQVMQEHKWKTRQDPFERVWEEVERLLKEDARFDVTTILNGSKGNIRGDFPMVNSGRCKER